MNMKGNSWTVPLFYFIVKNMEGDSLTVHYFILFYFILFYFIVKNIKGNSLTVPLSTFSFWMKGNVFLLLEHLPGIMVGDTL